MKQESILKLLKFPKISRKKLQPLLTILSVVVFLIPSGAQASATDENAPSKSLKQSDLQLITANHGKASFKKSLKNFGQVKRGQRLVAQYEFKNVGKGPLLVQAIHASCGCTEVRADMKRIYQPGESGSISVELDTTDYEGALHKSIAVMTSDSTRSVHWLHVEANIQSEIKVDPPILDFAKVSNLLGARKRVFLQPSLAVVKDFKVTGLQFDPSLVSASFEKSGDQWFIDVQVNPMLKTPFVSTTLFIENNSKFLPRIPLPIRADIQGNISLEPSYLEFGAVAQNKAVTKKLKMTSSEKFKVISHRTDLHINGRKVKDPENYFKLEGLDHLGHQRSLSAAISNPGKGKGSVHGRLFLETSDPSQPEIVMDFYAFFDR